MAPGSWLRPRNEMPTSSAAALATIAGGQPGGKAQLTVVSLLAGSRKPGSRPALRANPPFHSLKLVPVRPESK